MENLWQHSLKHWRTSMKIRTQERCMSCNKVISKKRYYCYSCFNDLEEKAGENNE
jgi:predicted amidophosphoribosyltransferase